MPYLPNLPILMLTTEPSERRKGIVATAVAGGVDMVQFRDVASPKSQSRSLNRERSSNKLGFIGLLHTFLGLQKPGQKTQEPKRMGCYVTIPKKAASSNDEVIGFQLTETTTTSASYIHEEFGLLVVGRSVHSVAAAQGAAADGADYLVAGTIYPSNSHPGEPGQGVGFLREVCAAVAPLPVIAIGGITPERVGECIAAGAAGVAVLSPIMRADDPQAVARTYREALDTAWNLRK